MSKLLQYSNSASAGKGCFSKNGSSSSFTFSLTFYRDLYLCVMSLRVALSSVLMVMSLSPSYRSTHVAPVYSLSSSSSSFGFPDDLSIGVTRILSFA